jgi:hypothetical protein
MLLLLHQVLPLYPPGLLDMLLTMLLQAYIKWLLLRILRSSGSVLWKKSELLTHQVR